MPASFPGTARAATPTRSPLTAQEPPPFRQVLPPASDPPQASDREPRARTAARCFPVVPGEYCRRTTTRGNAVPLTRCQETTMKAVLPTRATALAALLGAALALGCNDNGGD